MLDGMLLLRATVAEVHDAIPPRVELIVLEAWANDGTTGQAFALARRFVNAKIITVGPVSDEAATTGVCFDGASVGEKTRSQLIAWGIAPELIVDLRQRERGTHNEALLIASWLERQAPGAGSLIVVTEWYHRQRSRLTYRNVLRHIDVKVPDLPPGTEELGTSEWSVRERWSALVAEFIKLGYYQLRGWISPIQLVGAM